jgi:hypothetical protein
VSSVSSVVQVICGLWQAGHTEAAEHAAKLTLQRFVNLPMRVVDGGHDEVLEHVDIVFRDDLGIDPELLQMIVTCTMPPPAVASTLSSVICCFRRSCISCACFIIWLISISGLGARYSVLGITALRPWFSRPGRFPAPPARSHSTSRLASPLLGWSAPAAALASVARVPWPRR